MMDFLIWAGGLAVVLCSLWLVNRLGSKRDGTAEGVLARLQSCPEDVKAILLIDATTPRLCVTFEGEEPSILAGITGQQACDLFEQLRRRYPPAVCHNARFPRGPG